MLKFMNIFVSNDRVEMHYLVESAFTLYCFFIFECNYILSPSLLCLLTFFFLFLTYYCLTELRYIIWSSRDIMLIESKSFVWSIWDELFSRIEIYTIWMSQDIILVKSRNNVGRCNVSWVKILVESISIIWSSQDALLVKFISIVQLS